MIQAQPGISGTSITHPTDYRTFKPYKYRGHKPWKPAPPGTGEYVCETTGATAGEASYRKHIGHKDQPCGPCLIAKRLIRRHKKQLYTTGIDCQAPRPCSSDGYTWHQHQGETPCPECTRYHKQENQKC